MNALLIVTIFLIHDDGSITRDRQMSVKDSLLACQVAAAKRFEDLEKDETKETRIVKVECELMATLEVVKPPAPKPKPAPPPLRNGGAT